MNKKVKLLIITQKVDKNDDILGFFHRWLLEFAKHYEKLTVICLEEGDHDFYSVKNAKSRSENSAEFSGTGIKVLSLGKEKYFRERCDLGEERSDGRRSFLEEKIFSKLKYIFNFYRYIWSERKNYDAVFVHMNPIYVMLGGCFWRLWKKKIGLWYTHKSVDIKLYIAEKLTNYIFTASDKSFRLKSRKLHIMGHGIDANEFELNNKGQSFVATKDCPLFSKDKKFKKINILHIGRISSTKNIHLFIEIADILKKAGIKFKINILGAPITQKDEEYLKKIKKSILDRGLIEYFNFVGAILPSEASSYYRKNDIFINLSDTGSMDKTVLEAILSGIQVLVSNEAFDDILPERNKTTKDPERITKDIQKIANIKPNPSLREYVFKNHDLESLVLKLSRLIK